MTLIIFQAGSHLYISKFWPLDAEWRSHSPAEITLLLKVKVGDHRGGSGSVGRVDPSGHMLECPRTRGWTPTALVCYLYISLSKILILVWLPCYYFSKPAIASILLTRSSWNKFVHNIYITTNLLAIAVTVGCRQYQWKVWTQPLLWWFFFIFIFQHFAILKALKWWKNKCGIM